jgi:hypothetical protein
MGAALVPYQTLDIVGLINERRSDLTTGSHFVTDDTLDLVLREQFLGLASDLLLQVSLLI